MTVAVLGEGGFNPLRAVSEDLVYASAFFYEPLIRLGPSMVPEGVIASDWSSGDGKIWTLTLNENVLFSDGTPLTSGDVAATVDALKSGGGIYSQCVENVEKCEAPDAGTVVVTLAEPDGCFPWKLFFPVLKASETGSSFPAGTGPFSFVSVNGAGSEAEYGRNAYYHGEKAKIDGIIIRFYRSADEMAVSGCDLITLTGDGAVKYGSILGYDSKSFDGNSLICMVPYVYTGGNVTYRISETESVIQKRTSRETVLNIDMRRAVSALIDRERIIQRTVSGEGKAYDWPGLDNNIFRKKAEIAPASETLMTELLGKCGYFHEGGNTAWYRADDTEKNAPLTFNFIVDASDVELIQTCDSVVSQMKAVGIKANVAAVNGLDFPRGFLSGDYDYAFMRLNMSFCPDLEPVFANGGVLNYNGSDIGGLAATVRGLKRSWRSSGSGAASCESFSASFGEGLAGIYDSLRETLPFEGLYVRRGRMLTSERLFADETAGEEPWNLYANVWNWYLS